LPRPSEPGRGKPLPRLQTVSAWLCIYAKALAWAVAGNPALLFSVPFMQISLDLQRGLTTDRANLSF